MSTLETIRERLGVAGPWIEQGGAYWLDPGAADVRILAGAMNEAGARFVTITAFELPPGEGFRLDYHWDLGGKLLGFSFRVAGSAAEGGKIKSIFDLCEAADWIEREVHDEYGIEFAGRVCEPLLLREGDQPGVNLREAEAAGKHPSVLPRQEEAAR